MNDWKQSGQAKGIISTAAIRSPVQGGQVAELNSLKLMGRSVGAPHFVQEAGGVANESYMYTPFWSDSVDGHCGDMDGLPNCTRNRDIEFLWAATIFDDHHLARNGLLIPC